MSDSPRQTRGTVYLVGAGPGDPALLTRRASELLSTVDVVAYDALITPAILTLVNPKAELLSVGYRGYGSSRLKHRMHPEVIDRALKGLNVVRLKSGDPWIFGRAGHECEELLENEIPFEVVPGITAALGAAAYAGFPLTHKDLSSDVVLTSGHDLRGEFHSNSDWNALARSAGTLAIYMAATKVRENCDRLMQMGRRPDTPAAIVAQGTQGRQRVITGTLTTLPDMVGVLDQKVPAVMMIGETIGLRDKFRWLERKPLHDLTLLLVRARQGHSKLAELMRGQGAELIEAPWITTHPLDQYSELDQAIHNLPRYHNVVFSCEGSVEHFMARLRMCGRDLRRLREVNFVTVGSAIVRQLEACGVTPDIVLTGHCLEAVTAQQSRLNCGKSLVVTSTRGRHKLHSFFETLQLAADFVDAYEYRVQFPNIPAPEVDFVLLPSSTSAALLLEGPWGETLRHRPMVALGPITQSTARDHGATQVYRTASDDIKAVLPLLCELKARTRDEAKP